MFPKVLAHPACGGAKSTPVCSVNCAGCSPDICIMMRNPASCTIHISGCLSTCLRHVSHHLKERLCQICQVSFFCRPVIHFRININGVFAIPGWRHLIIPYTLQISCLTTWL